MKKKPTYQELENKIKELEQKTAKNLVTENNELHLLSKELTKKNKLLTENKNKFLNLFDQSPVSILEQDFYEAIELLNKKKDRG